MEISERQKQIVFARESLESANSIVLRWGMDGAIHFMNDFGLRFFGYSSEELIGQATTSQAGDEGAVPVRLHCRYHLKPRGHRRRDTFPAKAFLT